MLLCASLLAALALHVPAALGQSPAAAPCPGGAGALAPLPQNTSRCALANSTLPMTESFDIFSTNLYQRRNASGVGAFFNPTYVQHNPYIPDGAAAAVRALTTGFTNGSITVMNRILPGDTGIAMVHYKYVPPGPGQVATAVVDVFRMEGPCIAEHWDVGQPLPANATNPHPLFSWPALPGNATAPAPPMRARRLRRRVEA